MRGLVGALVDEVCEREARISNLGCGCELTANSQLFVLAARTHTTNRGPGISAGAGISLN